MDQELREKLARRCHPVEGFEIGLDGSDLEPLREMLRGVRIIALGEGSHGTSEHFRLKNRIIRFLVEEMGFQTFSIEASLWDCKNIDDYVMMGKGDKNAALASQRFWTWDTHEVMELIDWMRDYNLRCPRGKECHFLGFDMQIIGDICARMAELFELMDAASAEKTRLLLQALRETKRGTDYAQLEQHTLWLYGWYQANLDLLKNRLGSDRAALFEDGLRTLVQFIIMTQQEDVNDARDRFMAENVAWQVDHLDPATKVILWAHNGHISKKFTWTNLGQLLAERYGSQYYALGFALGGGVFQSRLYNRENGEFGALQNFKIPPFAENSWERELAQLYGQDYFMDVRSIRADAGLRVWADQCKPFVMLDEAWDPVHGLHHYEFPMVLSECYDGIVFTHRTTAAVPNETGKRG